MSQFRVLWNKNSFYFKKPSAIDYTKGLFSLGFCLGLCSLQQKEGRGSPGRLLSWPVVRGSPPDHPSWGWHGTQLESEIWMFLVGRRGQDCCSRFKIFAACILPWEQHHSGTAFVVIHSFLIHWELLWKFLCLD